MYVYSNRRNFTHKALHSTQALSTLLHSLEDRVDRSAVIVPVSLAETSSGLEFDQDL